MERWGYEQVTMSVMTTVTASRLSDSRGRQDTALVPGDTPQARSKPDAGHRRCRARLHWYSCPAEEATVVGCSVRRTHRLPVDRLGGLWFHRIERPSPVSKAS